MADADIAGTLQAAGMNAEDAEKAAQGYAAIRPLAASAVTIAQGGSVDPAELAPLIGAALLATGGVAAPVAAAVTVGVPMAEALLKALGVGGGDDDQHYDWTVGKMGFRGKRPWGPTDPTWLRWPDFATGDVMLRAGSNSNDRHIDRAFPEYRQLVDVDKYGDSSRDAFFRAYRNAWIANAERAINGHPYATDGALLEALTSAWNMSHGASEQVAIAPNETGNFVERLMAGQYDGQRRAPITVNIGGIADANAHRLTPKGLGIHGKPTGVLGGRGAIRGVGGRVAPKVRGGSRDATSARGDRSSSTGGSGAKIAMGVAAAVGLLLLVARR